MSSDNHIPEKLRHLLATLDGIYDTGERVALLVDFAKRFTPVPSGIAERPYPESHRVPFCESEAYVWAVPSAEGTLKFHFAVENPSGVSAKALAAILDATLSGTPVDQVAAVTPDIVTRIFRQNISMGKGMGLMGMVQRVQSLARAHAAAARP
ncbi:MAG: SufE family protein [Bacteroidota bacterium]